MAGTRRGFLKATAAGAASFAAGAAAAKPDPDAAAGAVAPASADPDGAAAPSAPPAPAPSQGQGRYGIVSPPDVPPTSRHIIGTLRFGRDAGTSVCNRSGRFHDIGNLYAADGALFPTSSGYNPLLTISAVGAWVGASMLDPERPVPGHERPAPRPA